MAVRSVLPVWIRQLICDWDNFDHEDIKDSLTLFTKRVIPIIDRLVPDPQEKIISNESELRMERIINHMLDQLSDEETVRNCYIRPLSYIW